MSHHEGHGASRVQGAQGFVDRLSKILDHWVHHNEDHAQALEQWAQKAADEGMAEAAARLREAASMNLAVNGKLREVLDGLKP